MIRKKPPTHKFSVTNRYHIYSIVIIAAYRCQLLHKITNMNSGNAPSAWASTMPITVTLTNPANPCKRLKRIPVSGRFHRDSLKHREGTWELL